MDHSLLKEKQFHSAINSWPFSSPPSRQQCLPWEDCLKNKCNPEKKCCINNKQLIIIILWTKSVYYHQICLNPPGERNLRTWALSFSDAMMYIDVTFDLDPNNYDCICIFLVQRIFLDFFLFSQQLFIEYLLCVTEINREGTPLMGFTH